MLDELLRLVRIDRTGLAITVALGVFLGCGFGWVLDRLGGDAPGVSAQAAKATATATVSLPPLSAGGPDEVSAPRNPDGTAPVRPEPTAKAEPAPNDRDGDRARFLDALKRGVAQAEALGGTAEAAVMMDGWSAPVAVKGSRRMRMWSMSKPITAVAALQTADKPPSPELSTAMNGAITRSENCRQRRVVLGLQQLAGGTDQARAAIQAVTARAGAKRVQVATQIQPPDQVCHEWLNTQTIATKLGPALLLGTSTWTVVDAARFAFALGKGAYGEDGDRVLRLMRQRKKGSRELTAPDQFTAKDNWGAGVVFADQKPAYKAGWGGSNQDAFMGGQYVILDTPDGPMAIAVMFHPDQQPPDDDPGKTKMPQAIETMLSAVKAEIGG